MKVKVKDVVDAMDMFGDEMSAYLNKRTGEVVTLTTEELSAAEEEEGPDDYPEWQRESILKAGEIMDSADGLPCCRNSIFMSMRSWKSFAGRLRILKYRTDCLILFEVVVHSAAFEERSRRWIYFKSGMTFVLRSSKGLLLGGLRRMRSRSRGRLKAAKRLTKISEQ
jgi:hypothetical protein